MAFTVKVEGLKLGFCADIGHVTSRVKKELEECDYLYLEANHEPSMVHACPRPQVYKQRVLGRQGHLSNEDCVSLLKAIAHPKLKHVHLAHLSSECNSPDLAFKGAREALDGLKMAAEVSIAHQDSISRCVFF